MHNYFLQKVELLIGENCYCWPLKRVWKKVASQGKVSEKSGNLDLDIEWQPCQSVLWKYTCRLIPLLFVSYP